MVEDEPTAGPDLSWWTFDAPDDAAPPSSPFGEPVAWPDVDWVAETPPPVAAPAGPIAAPGEPGESDLAWIALDVPEVDPPGPRGEAGPLLEAAWPDNQPLVPDGYANDDADATVLAAMGAGPAFYGEPLRRDYRVGWFRRHATLCGLTAFVGLVVLGVVLSVRHDATLKPTTASPPGAPAAQIGTDDETRTLLPTTTTDPTGSIDLSDLAGAGSGAGAGAGGTALPGTGTAGTGRAPTAAATGGAGAPAASSGAAPQTGTDATGTTTTTPQTATSTTVSQAKPPTPPVDFTVPGLNTGTTKPSITDPNDRRR